MNFASLRRRNAYVVMGGVGVLVALGYLGMSLQLPFGRIDAPGAAVFPVVVGFVMGLAGLLTVREGLRMDADERIELPTGTDRKRLLRMLSVLVLYLVALPWLGHFVSNTLFCLFMVRVLSTVGWTKSAMYALLMSGGLHLVFVVLLKVPLPVGVLIW